MTATTEQHTLQDTMNRLETALLTPVIAGEMPAWVRSVEETAATFAVDWTREVHTALHVQYRDIAKADPELLPMVDKMIETDGQLLESFARFHEELHELSQQTEQVGWQESKLADRCKAIEDRGTRLILQIKKQQAAATTWLSEALYRDRGTKD
jgi:hypothetical protein